MTTLPAQFEVVDRPLDTQMTISMGPQHPSTHGVLRLELVLDGEMVVKATPDIGYLHTGMEKLFEYKKYQQGIVITDRMDYLNPLGNNLAYVLAGEKLLGLEIPERAQTIRVLMCVFFFQAEDGIRVHCVTGVQTYALPIYRLQNARLGVGVAGQQALVGVLAREPGGD